MVKPLSPGDALSEKAKNLPDGVITAINGLIWKKLDPDSGRVFFTQTEAVNAIIKEMPELKRQDVYDNHYLDFEPAYRQAGWKVVFDKKGYNEPGDNSFTLTKK